MYGYGSQVSIAVGKTTSNYTSVDQISGIGAGKGGYDIYVGGNTDLKGAVIAGSADASKNALSTGSLTFSDLQNKAEYDSFSASASGGGGGFGGSMSVPQSKDSSSTTKAGIAAGAIDVREQPGRDLSGLDRNPDMDAGGLKTIFDQKKVAERQEMGQMAGYMGFRAAGDVATKFEWNEASPEKIALHATVAAGMASLGGGTVGQAVAGATANQLAITSMVDSLKNAGYVEGTPGFASLLKVGSEVVGAAVGSGDGAAAALDATTNNYLRHDQRVLRDEELAECGDSSSCQKERRDFWAQTSASQSLALEAGYYDVMNPTIAQQLQNMNPYSPAYDELLAQGLASIPVYGPKSTGVAYAHSMVTESDGNPTMHASSGGLSAVDRARLETILLGPVFGLPGEVTGKSGGTPDQISAANNFGMQGMLMYTAGTWLKPVSEVNVPRYQTTEPVGVLDPLVDTVPSWSRYVQAENTAGEISPLSVTKWDTSITTSGSKYLNVATDITVQQFQANLMQNGYSISNQGTNKDGDFSVLTNGTSTYTIDNRTSTGVAGGQYSGPGGVSVKYSLKAE